MLGLFGDRDNAKYIRDGKDLELKISIIDSNDYIKEDNLFEENSIFIFLGTDHKLKMEEAQHIEELTLFNHVKTVEEASFLLDLYLESIGVSRVK